MWPNSTSPAWRLGIFRPFCYTVPTAKLDELNTVGRREARAGKVQAMARVEIKGEQHPIGEVFSERYAFCVPPYQRPYAWTNEHAGELLDDLLASLGTEDVPVDEVNPYFLGSVVVIKGDQRQAEIVDGQQRLITLTILLAALRSYIGSEFRESITRCLFQQEDPLKSIPAHYRVRPKERDATFFRQFIQEEEGIQRLRAQVQLELPESQRNMRDNALYYVRTLASLPAARQVQLAQFILQRCLVVVVSSQDSAAAYRIFSVLNNRGLDLTPADLLKAEVIGRVPSTQQQDYTERWEAAEERLGSVGFSEFFGHLRTMYRRARANGSILDEFRQYIIPAAPDVMRLIDDIVGPRASAYYVIKNAGYDHEDAEAAAAINTLLRCLGRIDNTDWMPPAILYLSLYQDQPARLKRFFENLERLAASLMIRRQYAHRRVPRYIDLLRAIEGEANLSEPGSPIQLTPPERDETINALSGDIYLMAATPRNYVLQRLDSLLAGSGAVYDRSIMTVEHVLPRTPGRGSEWTRWFPTDELRARYVHRLGNLALLTREKNRQAYNYDFATKKRTYFTSRSGISPFALTTQVLQEQEWTPEVVERRQQELVGRLRTLWRL